MSHHEHLLDIIDDHVEAINEHAEGLDKLREAVVILMKWVAENGDRLDTVVAKVNEMTDRMNAMSGFVRLL